MQSNYTRFRLIPDPAIIGRDPSAVNDSNGFWHGKAFVVQGLTDEGPASAWETLAAFTNLRLAQDFYQSAILEKYGVHELAH